MYSTLLQLGSAATQIFYMPCLLELARKVDTMNFEKFYYFWVHELVQTKELELNSHAQFAGDFASELENDMVMLDADGKTIPINGLELNISMYNVISDEERKKVVNRLIKIYNLNKPLNPNIKLMDYLTEKLGKDNALEIFLSKPVYNRLKKLLKLGETANNRTCDDKFFRYFGNITYPIVDAFWGMLSTEISGEINIENQVNKFIAAIKADIPKLLRSFDDFEKSFENGL